ncbi:MAG: hypothetical protein IPO40_13195 [Fibrobacteres bacterium]|nr:hypothetical protein [Fibrobacterota bacterium]
MRKLIFVALMAPMASFATDLIVFEANKPAVARDVNENFSRLDTAIQNRSTKSDLGSTDALLKSALNSVSQLQASKVDQSGMDKALAAKANQTDVEKALAAKLNLVDAEKSLATKADQSAVDKALASKASQTEVEKVAGGKADTAALAELARKQKADNESLNNALKSSLTAGNLAGIRDSLKLKTDTSAFNAFKRQAESALGGKQASLGFAPLNSVGGTISGDLTIAKALTVGSFVSAGGFKTGGDVSAVRGRFDTVFVPGGVIARYPDGLAGAIYGDKAGAPNQANYSLAWQRDGSEIFLRAGAKYLYLREKEAAPIYNDGASDRTVWHSGNLDPAAYVTTKSPVFAGNEANEITTVYNDNYALEKSIGGLASIRHALDFRWYDSHWQIGNVRSGAQPTAGFGISNGNSDLRVLVGLTETRIFGDLLLPTGKLAAAAGSVETFASPAN